MTRVFISYQSQDRAHASKLAGALTDRGFDVWWDHDLLSGDDFRKTILKQLETADAVIVIWSTHSIASPWVMDEADTANGRRRLLPVRFDPHFADIPIGFRSIQVQDLSGWSGDSNALAIQAIERKIDDIERGVRNDMLASVGKSMLDKGASSPDAKAIINSLSTSVGGMPLPRFAAGSLLTAIVAMSVLAGWYAMAGEGTWVWVQLIPVAWVVAIALRAGHQYLILASGRGARHFFDQTFTFWLIVCPLLAIIGYAVLTPSDSPYFLVDIPRAAIFGGACVLAFIIAARILVNLSVWLARKLD